MKLPNNINTIIKLDNWINEKNPKIIEINKKSNLKIIAEFNDLEIGYKNIKWNFFRNIPIKHL